jgi:hypothetical protein
MPPHRLRFTVRRMLAAVAISAMLLFIYRSCPSLDQIFNDGPFNAIATIKKDWDLGPSPTVMVDVFEGTIQVYPSDDGKVHAEVATVGQTKVDQATSEVALKEIDLSLDQRGDSLRIVARGASGYSWGNWIRKEAHLDLHVPPNVRLDLRTGRGEIRVGRDYVKNVLIHRPISAVSVRARNDSKYRLGYAEGNIIVETTAPPGESGAAPIPTRLQLDAVGQIEIRSVDAIVEARAWHGEVPKNWNSADYEQYEKEEGSIRFEGRLASGIHSFRAAHRIEMILSPEAAFRVDAEATGDAILGDLLPKPVEPREGRALWKETIGPEPRGLLRLRTDQGAITLKQQAGLP